MQQQQQQQGVQYLQQQSIQSPKAAGCRICGTKSALVCPACINNTLVYERRRMLVELSERREGLLRRLNSLLAQQQSDVERQVRHQHLATSARQAQERAAQAEVAVAEAKRQVEQLRSANAVQRERISRLAADLAVRRGEHLSRHPTLLRYQWLTHSHVAAMLLAEQRAKLAVLLETLPLRISAIRTGAAGQGGAPLQVNICNLKLPDNNNSVSALMLLQSEATSCALGYMLLFLELVSTYLGGPLLHEGSFQGSTSVVWQQTSFWNRRPSSSNSRLPLFLEEGMGVGGSALSSAFPSLGLSSKPRAQTAWGSAAAAAQQGASGAVAALTRVMSPPSGGSSGGGSGGGSGSGGSLTGGGTERQLDEALARQRHTDLKAAYDMLLRSLSCFVRDKVQPLGLHLPPSWGPFGWLVVLMATVHRDATTESVLASAAAMAGGPGPGDPGEARGGTSGVGPGAGVGGGMGSMMGMAAEADVAGHEHYGGADDDAAEVEEDGWDVVQAPFLPPPPSQPDEVEHWTRAMFTDRQASRQQQQMQQQQARGHAGAGGGAGPGGGSGYSGRGGGQTGPQALGLDRVKAIFGK